MKFCKRKPADEPFCPLAEICFRCAKTAGRTDNHFEVANALFAYDKETKECPNLMNRAQYLVVRMYEN